MLVTLCTIRQLPQALALCDSFSKHSTESDAPVVIGLVDNPANLPANFTSPYPFVSIGDVIPTNRLVALSAVYTPTEFAAACKPLFLKHVFQQYTDVDRLIYADPNIWFTGPTAAIWDTLAGVNTLLTPHITQSPAQGATPSPAWPDEKFFQNIGLYSADFLAFRRTAETDRLLNWWEDRVTERAYIDPCAGLWTDQLWLMHVPVFFRDVLTVKNPGWHVALWNLPERSLHPNGRGWLVTGPAAQDQPLQFINSKGLLHPDEGFFPYQNRLHLSQRPDVQTVLNAYQKALMAYPPVANVPPAYGQQPEPVVLRGWRRATVYSLRAVMDFIDRVPIPVIR